MKIKYTNHAEYMFEKRKIDKVWVNEAVKYPDKTEKEDGKYYARKKLNGLTIEVVYEIVEEMGKKYIKVITVYPD